MDLLPDRAAGTLAGWLKSHPGVEVVSRDRATVYAQAAREAAPKATQVADWFHLLLNLRGAVERSLARQSSAVRAAFEEPDATQTALTHPRQRSRLTRSRRIQRRRFPDP